MAWLRGVAVLLCCSSADVVGCLLLCVVPQQGYPAALDLHAQVVICWVWRTGRAA